jgi:DNA polymerase III epsilon subunit-like protein
MGKLVVVDTETTGLDPINGDLIQVAFLHLTEYFIPDKRTPPFYLLIRPKKYQPTQEYKDKIAPAMAVNHLDIDDVMKIGLDQDKAADLFDEWWQRLGAQKLDILAQNYAFDRSFLVDWLGRESFDQFFTRYYRDTYVGGNFLNDQAKYSGSLIPFPDGCSLKKLTMALHIENPKAHDAFSDCLATAEVYKKMLNWVHVPMKVELKTS